MEEHVPTCDLRAFVDPQCPPEHEPQVWVSTLEGGPHSPSVTGDTAALTD